MAAAAPAFGLFAPSSPMAAAALAAKASVSLDAALAGDLKLWIGTTDLLDDESGLDADLYGADILAHPDFSSGGGENYAFWIEPLEL
jgi:hypothetical protein